MADKKKQPGIGEQLRHLTDKPDYTPTTSPFPEPNPPYQTPSFQPLIDDWRTLTSHTESTNTNPAPVQTTIGPQPSYGQRLVDAIRHPLNSLEAASQPVMTPRGASFGERVGADLSNLAAGPAGMLRHPIKTLGGMMSSGFGARPILETAANTLTGRNLYPQAPMPLSHDESVYAAGQQLPFLAAAGAGLPMPRGGGEPPVLSPSTPMTWADFMKRSTPPEPASMIPKPLFAKSIWPDAGDPSAGLPPEKLNVDFLNQVLGSHNKTPPFEAWLRTENNLPPIAPVKEPIRPQDPVFPGFFGTATKDKTIDKWTDPFWRRPLNPEELNQPLPEGLRGLPGAAPAPLPEGELPSTTVNPFSFSNEGLFKAPGISESERLDAIRLAMAGEGTERFIKATNRILDKYPELFSGPHNPQFEDITNPHLPASILPPLPPPSLGLPGIEYLVNSKPMDYTIPPDITPKK